DPQTAQKNWSHICCGCDMLGTGPRWLGSSSPKPSLRYQKDSSAMPQQTHGNAACRVQSGSSRLFDCSHAEQMARNIPSANRSMRAGSHVLYCPLNEGGGP